MDAFEQTKHVWEKCRPYIGPLRLPEKYPRSTFSLTLCLTLALTSPVTPALGQDSFGQSGRQIHNGRNQGLQPQPYQNPNQGFGQGNQQSGNMQNSSGGFLDQLVQMERQDLGVSPTNRLHNGPMHGATPNSIPGGQVITTKGVLELVEQRRAPYLLFDILGGQEMIPGAIPAVAAAQPGSFNDRNQQDFGAYLQQVTQGNKQYPLIFYCLSIECWMSYNASLRAINLGYTNVFWYRGGISAWKQAGRQTVNAGGGAPFPQSSPHQQQGRQWQPQGWGGQQ